MCRAPLSPAPEGERKQVTVLFADVARSMELAERLDPDEWSQIVQGLYARCAGAVERFGGIVDKFTGDGVMALFGAPVAQEDHALRACHAGLALLDGARAFAAELAAAQGVELAVRVGLNSGEVVVGAVGAGYTAVGHTVGLAQRMEGLAEPGGIAISEHTAALVAQAFSLRSRGPVEVKGATAPVGVYVLEPSVGSLSAMRRRTGAARLVGRQPELASLCAALDGAADGEARIIGIVGEAGVGKSRLCEELTDYAVRKDVTVRRAAGVSLATSVPLLPIRSFLRDHFEIVDADTADGVRAKVSARMLALSPEFEADLGLVFDLLDVPDPARPVPQLGPEPRRRRVLDVMRRATQRRSEVRTMLLVLEDLHWFDPDSVAFIDAWLPSFAGTRTLVVLNFRPEFRPGFAGLPGYRALALAPLGEPSGDELVAELLGNGPGLAELALTVRRRAGGNPLFAEEIVRALVADGTLVGEPGAYALARPVGQVKVPATVQAVLAGRIDRLRVRDKGVLQAASVIGRTFSAPVLRAVTGLDDVALAASVRSLCSAELLQDMPADGECRFWHPLTQEVAYGSLLTAARRRLHAAVAAALVAVLPDRLDELAPLLATHYGAACDPLEAARWQLRSAIRLGGNDFGESMRRLRIALAHLDAVPETPDSLRLAAGAATMLLRLGGSTGMPADETDRTSVRAQMALERLGEPGPRAAYGVAEGIVRFYAGELSSASPAFEEGMRWAEVADSWDTRWWARALSSIVYGWSGPVAIGLQRIEEVLASCGRDKTAGTATVAYSVYDAAGVCRALLYVPHGDLALARHHHGTALEAVVGTRPMTQFAAWVTASSVAVAFWTGEPARVDEADRTAAEALQLARDCGSVATHVAAQLAQGMAALLGGRPADAADVLGAGLAEARAHRAGQYEEASLLAHLASARLSLGDAIGARAAAEEAVAVARRQGARVVECLAHMIRARVWRETAACESDVAEARAAVASGLGLVEMTGARTYAPFLTEQKALLHRDLTVLQACAEAYEVIGATGHARRVQAEFG